MVTKFEVGKTYRYTGEIGNPSPFTSIGINEQDARFIVSGKPLVCTYSESEDSFDDTLSVGFKGMSHEHDGWAFQSKWHMFEEIEETKEAREEKKMVKFEVGKKYRYKGSIDELDDFRAIFIGMSDAEYIVSGKPLTVEKMYSDYQFKFKELSKAWSFLYGMLEKFEEVPAPVAPYAERQSKWVKDNNIVHGSKVRLLRSYEPNEEGYVTEYPYAGKKITKHPVGQVFRVCYEDSYMGMVLAPTDDDFECNIGNYFPYFVLEKVADDTPVYGEPVAPPKASYSERQAEWVKQNKIEKGSKVRLVATATHHEDGWMNSWVDVMSEHVGQIGTVIDGLTSTYGMRVAFGENMYSGFEYPYFVLEAVKETPTKSTKSVKEFEAGKWYVCHATERLSRWNPSGKMDALLDGKPHKCTFGKGYLAEFEGMPQRDGGGWSFWRDLDYFEEVPAPNADVDWQKKYTELKRKAIAMLSAYGDASKSFTEELEAL